MIALAGLLVCGKGTVSREGEGRTWEEMGLKKMAVPIFRNFCTAKTNTRDRTLDKLSVGKQYIEDIRIARTETVR